jgi:hypothetical protein
VVEEAAASLNGIDMGADLFFGSLWNHEETGLDKTTRDDDKPQNKNRKKRREIGRIEYEMDIKSRLLMEL